MDKKKRKRKNKAGREVGGNRSADAVVLLRLDAVSSMLACGKSSQTIVNELSVQFGVHVDTVYNWLGQVKADMKLAAKEAIGHRLEMCLMNTIQLRDAARSRGEFGTAGAMQKEINALLGAHQAGAEMVAELRSKTEAEKQNDVDVSAMTSGQLRSLLADILAVDKTAPD